MALHRDPAWKKYAIDFVDWKLKVLHSSFSAVIYLYSLTRYTYYSSLQLV